MIGSLYSSVISILILCSTIERVNLWPNHDISTLKLLQVVHRHGDRTITTLYPNDPFINLDKYWPEGLGELTTAGKYRMYKLGEFIRKEYHQYLGENYNPREVYARSTAKYRCLESVSCLLSGAYPPVPKEWQWSNESTDILGAIWQPFPIETFIPMNDDLMLRTEAYCPRATEEMNKIFMSEPVVSALNNVSNFLAELSARIGSKINSLMSANSVYITIKNEYDRGYDWSNHSVWPPEYTHEIFDTLLPLTKLLWRVEWDNSVVKRTRAGILVQELLKNIVNKLKSGEKRKLFVYSTQDSMMGVLMHALSVYNNELIPYSASLFVELHQKPKTDYYFVRVYYYNETITDKPPHLLVLPNCDKLSDCPIDQFTRLAEDLIPSDWKEECGIGAESVLKVLKHYITYAEKKSAYV